MRFYCKRAAKMRHAYQAIADAAIRAGGSGVGSKGISAADIRRAITMLDLKVSIDDVDRLLASIDINRDGCVGVGRWLSVVVSRV